MTVAEVASLLGISVRAVNKRAHVLSAEGALVTRREGFWVFSDADVALLKDFASRPRTRKKYARRKTPPQAQPQPQATRRPRPPEVEGASDVPRDELLAETQRIPPPQPSPEDLGLRKSDNWRLKERERNRPPRE